MAKTTRPLSRFFSTRDACTKFLFLFLQIPSTLQITMACFRKPYDHRYCHGEGCPLPRRTDHQPPPQLHTTIQSLPTTTLHLLLSFCSKYNILLRIVFLSFYSMYHSSCRSNLNTFFILNLGKADIPANEFQLTPTSSRYSLAPRLSLCLTFCFILRVFLVFPTPFPPCRECNCIVAVLVILSLLLLFLDQSAADDIIGIFTNKHVPKIGGDGGVGEYFTIDRWQW